MLTASATGFPIYTFPFLVHWVSPAMTKDLTDVAYMHLRLPDDLPESLEAFVRGSLEPYLMDVHVMLGVTGPIADPKAMPHLLGRSIALTLLTVVSSAADTLFAKRGTNKEKFIGVLNAYYPWDRASVSGVSKEDAAKLLYREFRNPIAHRAGIRPAGGPIMGIYLPFPGSADPYREIVAFEQSDQPPSNDTLNIDSGAIHLEVRTFYWGVRKMVEKMTADHERWSDMVDWLRNHRFMPGTRKARAPVQERDNSQEVWLRTDEIEEFIGSLEHSAWLAKKVGNDVTRWKWLILSLHGALQGAFTCALRGEDTAGISMLTKKSGEAVWHWLDVESRKKSPGPRPEEKLASMMDLYKRVRNSNYLKEPHRLRAHPQMNKDIKKLNDLRNNFSHFTLGGFSLEVSGMPRIVRYCCDVIEHLAVTHPTFWHHLTEAHRIRIKTGLLTLRTAMDSWQTEM